MGKPAKWVTEKATRILELFNRAKATKSALDIAVKENQDAQIACYEFQGDLGILIPAGSEMRSIKLDNGYKIEVHRGSGGSIYVNIYDPQGKYL